MCAPIRQQSSPSTTTSNSISPQPPRPSSRSNSRWFRPSRHSRGPWNRDLRLLLYIIDTIRNINPRLDLRPGSNPPTILGENEDDRAGEGGGVGGQGRRRVTHRMYESIEVVGITDKEHDGSAEMGSGREAAGGRTQGE